MRGHIVEKERSIDIVGSYDVAVAGGGIAGVSAALAAARLGQKVVIIERMYAMGGLATLGLVTIFLPLCDGCGRQVSFGIAEELIRLSVRHGYETDYPYGWLNPAEDGASHGAQRYQVRYNAQVFSVLLEQLLKEEHVDILYGTLVAGVCKEEGSIKALIIENKNGRSVIGTGSVVDATGDADICKMAGAELADYKKGNALAAWFYETVNGRTSLHMLGAADVLAQDGDVRIPDKLEGKRISGMDAAAISEMMVESHARSLEAFLKCGDTSETHSLTALAAIPQLRMTRRLCGSYTLDDSEKHKRFEDSIGMVGDWRKRGPVHEIPLRSLYTEKVRNLAAAGRCISVTDSMWDITRVIPASAVTGQAAGTALALNKDITGIDVISLQKSLRGSGVRLHEDEL